MTVLVAGSRVRGSRKIFTLLRSCVESTLVEFLARVSEAWIDLEVMTVFRLHNLEGTLLMRPFGAGHIDAGSADPLNLELIA